MLSQQVAKSQNSRLVWQAHGTIEADEAPVQGSLVQLFFCGRIADASPQLQAVGTQHGLDGKQRSSAKGLVCAMRIRLNKLNPRSPGDHLVHVTQKDFFACLFVQRIEAERDLIHDLCFHCLQDKR